MNVRLELMESDTELIGIISTRGYDKGAVYGCDYLVAGRGNGNRLLLVRKNVQRAVSMSKQECSFFQRLELFFPSKDSAVTASSKWIWGDGSEETFALNKTEPVVSEIAKDEVEFYFEELYNNIEERGILLTPEDRIPQKVGEISVDSTELVIDINSIEKDIHDSITVVFNGEPIAEKYNLYKKPLRIRLQQVQPGISDIIVISESQGKKKLNLQIAVKQKELVKEFIVEPSFVRNVMLLLVQKQE